MAPQNPKTPEVKENDGIARIGVRKLDSDGEAIEGTMVSWETAEATNDKTGEVRTYMRFTLDTADGLLTVPCNLTLLTDMSKIPAGTWVRVRRVKTVVRDEKTRITYEVSVKSKDIAAISKGGFPTAAAALAASRTTPSTRALPASEEIDG